MKLIYLLLLTCSLNAAFAQNQQTVTYFDAKNKKVNTQEDAEYTRTIFPYVNNLFRLEEIYKNGNIKREAILTTFEPRLKYTGTLTNYYKNGNKESIHNYNFNGNLEGESYSFYQNGNLKEKRIYWEIDKKDVTIPASKNYRTLQIADSLGNTFLDSNGTGKFSISIDNGNIESGEYILGIKTGFWRSYYAKSNMSYEDEYVDGKFIKGRTVNADGTTLDYDVLDLLPTFNGGIKAFSEYLSRKLQYPSDAKTNKIQGKVYIGFVVEKDGKLADIKVTKGVSPDLYAEALRVMRLSPNWIPGMQRGKPVRVSYTIPIVFKLQ